MTYNLAAHSLWSKSWRDRPDIMAHVYAFTMGLTIIRHILFCRTQLTNLNEFDTNKNVEVPEIIKKEINRDTLQ